MDDFRSIVGRGQISGGVVGGCTSTALDATAPKMHGLWVGTRINSDQATALVTLLLALNHNIAMGATERFPTAEELES